MKSTKVYAKPDHMKLTIGEDDIHIWKQWKSIQNFAAIVNIYNNIVKPWSTSRRFQNQNWHKIRANGSQLQTMGGSIHIPATT
jgi:hypothetical protein